MFLLILSNQKINLKASVSIDADCKRRQIRKLSSTNTQKRTNMYHATYLRTTAPTDSFGKSVSLHDITVKHLQESNPCKEGLH